MLHFPANLQHPFRAKGVQYDGVLEVFVEPGRKSRLEIASALGEVTGCSARGRYLLDRGGGVEHYVDVFHHEGLVRVADSQIR